ncbi:thiamine transporter [Bacillus mesophilus]|uniref:Energy-coupled thiamine transporter ThiT n=1 Tax=Bacillus mesophilus TaxID=1808955 RepID=A0A6M0Q933_9BACI|nr:energy-coupled thiamine transporter ThiT [Bacillus mesophilus]MBM7661357.1 thiamine transporter [Bacillus mesophilus]NEY72030.1 energy-coupled thiamine transporter ThiT [Bacillus mesophilus]
MQNKKIVFLVEVAIFSSLAYLLDFLSFKIWAQGGSVSLSMVPVFFIAFRWGIKGGLLSGLLYGALQLITTPYIYSIPQAFMDYILAFTLLGLAGLVSGRIKTSLIEGNKSKLSTYIILGALIGSSIRFLAHYIGGIIFFADYAPEGTPVALYSLLYNGSYMLPAFILSSIVLILMVSSSKRLLQTN